LELSNRGTLMVAFEHQALTRLGRLCEARAAIQNLYARAATEYIGDSVALFPALASGDEDAIADALQLNIDAGTGPTTFSIAIDVELKALLPHPRLGPLVRQLSLFAQRPAT
jgi:hypothetical protein